MRLRIKIVCNKVVLLGLLILLGIFVGCLQKSVTSENFEVKRGTNIAHWLSQSDRRGIEREQFFTKSDVKKIASMGFDHIRLPIDEEQMWDEKGNRYDAAFKLMENAVEWCAESNLRIIIDLHILRSHHFNATEKPLWTDPEEQEKFFDLWRDLSKSLKKFPNSLVAYELMNEAVADNHESWNSLLTRAFNAIRELEKERTIVIGSNMWQSVETFDALKVPENDKNILLSFHFYKPFLLTHYAAKWTSLKAYNGPVHYPGIILTQQEFEILPENIKTEVDEWVGKEFNKDILFEMWQKPIQKAKNLGLPLYCGEFGIISNAPDKETDVWYQDMIQLFEQTGIGYANWNYKSDNFGLLYYDGKENKDLIKIISGSN
ncbi:glycoside hydrolase family 5 protein [Flavivirga algicola]|uniref:Glycoside hydrolase family 5 protein n=1 Tax=Flavivirga algicola TaxID=2729136 RepID=A0ABX1RZC9_9FLAO|nr:glycoside hydrolase family 5 protein [Flavivirga algicola]NMH88355.1 glycoside hydrolase family 5 protein [Flavivirga algicola]